MKMLTVAEAAELLDLSASLVYALVAARRIRHERHGLGRGVIKIPVEAIDEYRRSVTVPAVIVEPKPARRFKHLS